MACRAMTSGAGRSTHVPLSARPRHGASSGRSGPFGPAPEDALVGRPYPSPGRHRRAHVAALTGALLLALVVSLPALAADGAPTLTKGTISPAGGVAGTSFTVRVTYTSSGHGGHGWRPAYVTLWLGSTVDAHDGGRPEATPTTTTARCSARRSSRRPGPTPSSSGRPTAACSRARRSLTCRRSWSGRRRRRRPGPRRRPTPRPTPTPAPRATPRHPTPTPRPRPRP